MTDSRNISDDEHTTIVSTYLKRKNKWVVSTNLFAIEKFRLHADLSSILCEFQSSNLVENNSFELMDIENCFLYILFRYNHNREVLFYNLEQYVQNHYNDHIESVENVYYNHVQYDLVGDIDNYRNKSISYKWKV
jgi:hypothetical protein